MLNRSQERLIRSLHTRMNRQRSGLCLVEGAKLVREAAEFLEFDFGPEDSPDFPSLVTTETPQDRAAVARIPRFSEGDVCAMTTIAVLDGVQDPGNVGTALRLGLGFGAGLVLVESAEASAPKTIRASAGAVFRTPWISLSRPEAEGLLKRLGRPVFRLEKRPDSEPLQAIAEAPRIVLIAGSEGHGIAMGTDGRSVAVSHDRRLESLNVSQALSIALHLRYGASGR